MRNMERDFRLRGLRKNAGLKERRLLGPTGQVTR